MATTRKSTQSRTPAKRAASSRSRDNGSSPEPQTEPQTETQAEPQSLRSVAILAAREIAQLIGHRPEGIVAVEKSEAGWQVKVQVVEAHRIPATTDIMAVYEVEVGNDGAVTGYRRADRYVRGRIQE